MSSPNLVEMPLSYLKIRVIILLQSFSPDCYSKEQIDRNVLFSSNGHSAIRAPGWVILGLEGLQLTTS